MVTAKIQNGICSTKRPICRPGLQPWPKGSVLMQLDDISVVTAKIQNGINQMGWPICWSAILIYAYHTSRSIVLRAKGLAFLSPAQRAGERRAPRAACGLKGRDGLYDMATRNYRDPSGRKRFFRISKTQADWPGLRNVGPSARESMREPGPPAMFITPGFDDRATLGQGTRPI